MCQKVKCAIKKFYASHGLNKIPNYCMQASICWYDKLVSKTFNRVLQYDSIAFLIKRQHIIWTALLEWFV